jgi:RNA polymerase sigma-70 factor (ECF subfamily)
MTDTPDPEFLRRLEQAVLNLPKLQREIFLACRLDDMPYREIAERTGLTTRRVERHIAKAIYKIAKQMDGIPLRWWERWF